MKERVKELATEVGISVEYLTNTKQWTLIEALAELIVRECVECLKPLSRNHSMVGAAQDTIREHFGVE